MRAIVGVAVAILLIYGTAFVTLLPKIVGEFKLRHLKAGVAMVLQLLEHDPGGWQVGVDQAIHRGTGITVFFGDPNAVYVQVLRDDAPSRATVAVGPLSSAKLIKAIKNIRGLDSDKIARAIDAWIAQQANPRS